MTKTNEGDKVDDPNPKTEFVEGKKWIACLFGNVRKICTKGSCTYLLGTYYEFNPYLVHSVSLFTIWMFVRTGLYWLSHLVDWIGLHLS